MSAPGCTHAVPVAPCTRCGTFLCPECRPSGQCAACEARLTANPIPLEDPTLPVWRRALGTLWELTVHPLRFHDRAAKGDGIVLPVLFVSSLNLISTLPALVFLAGNPELLGAGVVTIVTSVAFPITRIVGLTVLLHPIEYFWRPGPRFAQTFRALTWSSVFSIVSVVPFVGPLLAAIFVFAHVILGLRAVHPKRWVGALVILTLLFVMLIALFVVTYRAFESTMVE